MLKSVIEFVFSVVIRLVVALLFAAVTVSFTWAQQSDKSNQSWSDAQKAKKGVITVFWNNAPPFMWKDATGHLHGIEYELILGFKKYVKSVHHTDLEIRWKQENFFHTIYERIVAKEEPASFGASGISITTERQQEVAFSPSYMADITVMISSESVPIAKNIEEFRKISQSLTAVTIERSTFEKDLLKLRQAGDLSFPIQYVQSSIRVFEEIEKRDNAFGIIDLALYLNLFEKNPEAKLNRQNLFSKIRKGFGLIYPLGSDWGEPMTQYFHDKHFRDNLRKIIAGYINMDNYNFIESLTENSDSQISLLTKEKEIQLEHLKEEIRTRNWGIVFLSITLISLVFIVFLFRRSRKLISEIEHQQKNIELQNRELAIKNKKLEEFTFANAYKLRKPVASVLELIRLFDSADPPKNDRIMEQLKQTSSDLDNEVKAIGAKLEADVWSQQE